LSDATTAGTAVPAATPGAPSGFSLDVSSMQAGNTINLTYTDTTTNTKRNITIMRVDDPSTLPLSNSVTADPNDTVVGIDFSGASGSIVSQLNAALSSSNLQFSGTPPFTTSNRLTVLNSPNFSTINSASVTTTETSLTSGNPQVTGWNNWVLQWSSTNANFTVVGIQSCSNNGCVVSAISPAATVNAAAFNTVPVSGWADSYGGSINIPPTGAPHATGDAVYYYSQSTVIPGTVSLTLYCLSQCPTASALASFSAQTQPTPFGNGTDTQWFSAASAANTVTYTFGASGLLDGSSPVILELASQYPSSSQYSQNGIQTGTLFDTALVSCPAGYPGGSVCAPSNPTTYYTWQTGPQQWNQSLWLTSGGNVVPFDPPQNVAYTVPTGSAYGAWAGLPILLQFNGFGNLFGIPGYCVSSVDNTTIDCSTPNARYVPMFSIPDGSLMSLPNPPTPLIVKALNGEIRLKNLGSGAAQCSAMTLAPLTLPSGGTHDPSSSSDSLYLGTMPTVTAAPKVIDGVVQP